MATVAFGSLVTEIRGRLGGHVFQKCGQVLSMRTQQSQRYSPSEAGLLSKSDFLRVANAWGQLTPAEKQSWTDNAASYPTLDRFGNSIVLTGYQLFIYINRSIAHVNYNFITTASAYYSLVSHFTSVSDIDLSAETFTASFSAGELADMKYLFYVSDYYGSDVKRNNPKSKFMFYFNPTYIYSVNLYPYLIDTIGYAPRLNDALYIEIWQQYSTDGVLSRIGTFKVPVVA